MNITKRVYISKRDTINDKRYNTRRWQKLRAQVLDRDGHLCQCKQCIEAGRITIATVADHIQPVTKGGSFWEEYNIQSLSVSCHQRKSAGERQSIKK